MKRGIPSLDGLRAISITFVLLAHLSYTYNFPLWGRDLGLPRLGQFGVRIFFIISGYLITSLLLKELDSTGTISLRRFYFRRAMRLFPAAYVMITVVAILTPVPSADLAASLTYTMNFRYGMSSGPTWNLGHLWSLAIEEQFYLLWPLLLCLLRRRRAVKLLLWCLLIAPLARLAMHWGLLVTSVSFLIASDALATGCLLSLLRVELWNDSHYRRVLESKLFFAVPVLAISLNYLSRFRIQLIETVINIAVAMTIDWAIRNHDSMPGRLLNLRPIKFIGVLSYSLYLWQQLFLKPWGTWTFPINIAMAVGLAIVSFYCVERPFLLLRGKLEQLAADRAAPRLSAVAKTAPEVKPPSAGKLAAAAGNDA